MGMISESSGYPGSRHRASNFGKLGTANPHQRPSTGQVGISIIRGRLEESERLGVGQYADSAKDPTDWRERVKKVRMRNKCGFTWSDVK